MESDTSSDDSNDADAITDSDNLCTKKSQSSVVDVNVEFGGDMNNNQEAEEEDNLTETMEMEEEPDEVEVFHSVVNSDGGDKEQAEKGSEVEDVEEEELQAQVDI